MRYAGIIKNDFAAAPGVCVTFFTQGCPHKCPGCHNPSTWDPEGGFEFTNETLQSIINAIGANGFERNLCIMGGEPLSPENQFLTYMVINEVKNKFPNIKIYVWTGYTLEELQKGANYPQIKRILKEIEAIVDGRFELDKRDITLQMRGSSNQNIIYMKDLNFDNDN